MVKLFITGCTKENEHAEAKSLAERAFFELFGRVAEMTHDSGGKPCFEGESGVSVSVSHSENLCLVAISDHQVGVDIEYMKPGDEHLIRLAERYFTRSEAEYVKLDPYHHFYEVWCKKESYVKYMGEGMSRAFVSFDVLAQKDVVYSYFNYEDYTVAVCTDTYTVTVDDCSVR